MLLLERARIASGTSWHAAGLVARVRGSHPMTELANYGVDLYRGLAEETGVDVHFRPTGSLTLAENDGRMAELRYAAAIARHHGTQARLLEPDEVPDVWPLDLDRRPRRRAPAARRRDREPGIRRARPREGCP